MILKDIWYVWILGRHKHQYKRIEDGNVEISTRENGEHTIKYQRHQCETCKKIVGLDDWQVADLPTDMLYEKSYEKSYEIDQYLEK